MTLRLQPAWLDDGIARLEASAQHGVPRRPCGAFQSSRSREAGSSSVRSALADRLQPPKARPRTRSCVVTPRDRPSDRTLRGLATWRPSAVSVAREASDSRIDRLVSHHGDALLALAAALAGRGERQAAAIAPRRSALDSAKPKENLVGSTPGVGLPRGHAGRSVSHRRRGHDRLPELWHRQPRPGPVLPVLRRCPPRVVSRARHEAQHTKVVTILFADVAGSTRSASARSRGRARAAWAATSR